jgi:hypothetical protein
MCYRYIFILGEQWGGGHELAQTNVERPVAPLFPWIY